MRVESNQRRTLLYGAIGAVVVALLVVGGIVVLGGDDGNKSKAQEARTAAIAELEAKLLVQSDVPAGYTAATAGGVVASDEKCAVVHRTERKGRVGIARAAFLNSAGGKSTQINEILSRYSAGGTGPTMAKARAAATDCASFTEAGAGADGPLTTKALPFPTLLEETVAHQITGTSGGTPVVFDQIFMRQGDTVVVLVHGGKGGVDTTVTEQIARKAAEKVARPV
jgi:hypothetical protein